jgi:predicted Zn-ribbon and HTH transcriptional regulator
MPYRVVGTLTVYDCECFRCGHAWRATGASPPTSCASCKSRSWNVRPGKARIGRPPKKA